MLKKGPIWGGGQKFLDIPKQAFFPDMLGPTREIHEHSGKVAPLLMRSTKFCGHRRNAEKTEQQGENWVK